MPLGGSVFWQVDSHAFAKSGTWVSTYRMSRLVFVTMRLEWSHKRADFWHHWGATNLASMKRVRGEGFGEAEEFQIVTAISGRPTILLT